MVMAVNKIRYKVVVSSNPGAEHKTNIFSKLFIVKMYLLGLIKDSKNGPFKWESEPHHRPLLISRMN